MKHHTAEDTNEKTATSFSESLVFVGCPLMLLWYSQCLVWLLCSHIPHGDAVGRAKGYDKLQADNDLDMSA